MKTLPQAAEAGQVLALIPKDDDLREMCEMHFNNIKVFYGAVAKIAEKNMSAGKPPSLAHLSRSLSAHEDLMKMNNSLYLKAKASPNFCGTYWMMFEALIVWAFKLDDNINTLSRAIEIYKNQTAHP